MNLSIKKNAKNIFSNQKIDSKNAIFFNLLVKKKLFNYLFSYGYLKDLNYNCTFDELYLVSKQTLIILTNIYKNFFYEFGKYIKINKVLHTKNCVDIHDIITSINFLEIFNSVDEIFFFRKLMLPNLKNDLYKLKNCKNEYFNKKFSGSDLVKIKEKKKISFYSGFRFFNILKYKYLYRLRHLKKIQNFKKECI
nr:hypothetical protein CcurKRNrm3_p142 [Cryptomonas curvata]